jgi:hypothetical protein
MASDDKASATAAVSGGSEEGKPGEPKVTDASPGRAASPAPGGRKKQPKEVSESEGISTTTVFVIGAIVLAIIGVAGGFYYWSTLPKEGELTKSTWDDATAGKMVFVKFLAPW